MRQGAGGDEGAEGDEGAGEAGEAEEAERITMLNAQCPMPHAQCPIFQNLGFAAILTSSSFPGSPISLAFS